jgi:hypothetical protein
LELRRYLGTDFETAPTDAGANRNHQIFGLAVEAVTHLVDCFRRDFRNYAAPTCVNRRYCPVLGIGDQNRQTIGGSDRQADARQIRNHCIALALWARRFHQQNAVGMDLLHRR